MTGTRSDRGWAGRLLFGLVLILIGAGAAIYGLAHNQRAARVLGVVPAEPPATHVPQAAVTAMPAAQQAAAPSNANVAALEQRLSAV